MHFDHRMSYFNCVSGWRAVIEFHSFQIWNVFHIFVALSKHAEIIGHFLLSGGLVQEKLQTQYNLDLWVCPRAGDHQPNICELKNSGLYLQKNTDDEILCWCLYENNWEPPDFKEPQVLVHNLESQQAKMEKGLNNLYHLSGKRSLRKNYLVQAYFSWRVSNLLVLQKQHVELSNMSIDGDFWKSEVQKKEGNSGDKEN